MQKKAIADEKKTLTVFIIALLLCISLSLNTVNAADKYIKLPLRAYTHTGDKIEVLEFFWYGCSHCYEFEPVIEQWLDDKAEYIEFVRMPAVLGASWMPYARAYYVAQHLDVLDKIHRPLFDAILEYLPPPQVERDAPARLLVTTLAYDNYIGKIGIGRLWSAPGLGVPRRNAGIPGGVAHIGPVPSRLARK